ncbi:hypothetical protein Plim_2134 [Planctopirus limnophila DSM 3776]|uniref:Uncharacterized protein n=1 Tax=Planctopirus limnophila (strain ATCC 43296 / DSM 3776 / IFAM 1008 / Mu 290) TaxID=521674 RepID=D5SMQ6_PLAL2|nr:hypothetical protein Plim_2134 [Planctopirus limnophila DSM 3776]
MLDTIAPPQNSLGSLPSSNKPFQLFIPKINEPIFQDYTPTTDELLNGGAISLTRFQNERTSFQIGIFLRKTVRRVWVESFKWADDNINGPGIFSLFYITPRGQLPIPNTHCTWQPTFVYSDNLCSVAPNSVNESLEAGRSTGKWFIFNKLDTPIYRPSLSATITICATLADGTTYREQVNLTITTRKVPLPRCHAVFGFFFEPSKINTSQVRPCVQKGGLSETHMSAYYEDMQQHECNTVSLDIWPPLLFKGTLKDGKLTAPFRAFQNGKILPESLASPADWVDAEKHLLHFGEGATPYRDGVKSYYDLQNENADALYRVAPYKNATIAYPHDILNSMIDNAKGFEFGCNGIPILTNDSQLNDVPTATDMVSRVGNDGDEHIPVEALYRAGKERNWPEIILKTAEEPLWLTPDEDKIGGAFILMSRQEYFRTETPLGIGAVISFGDLFSVWEVLAGSISPELMAEAARQRVEVWTYSFAFRSTNYRTNRFYSGVYTWALGLKGNRVYAYSTGPTYLPPDPLPAGAKPEARHGERRKCYSTHLRPLTWESFRSDTSTFPSNGFALPFQDEKDAKAFGVVGSVGYEGRADGATDFRILSLLEAELRENNSHPRASEARAWMEGVRRSLLDKCVNGSLLSEQSDSNKWDFRDATFGLEPIAQIMRTAREFIDVLTSSRDTVLDEQPEPPLVPEVKRPWEGRDFFGLSVKDAVEKLRAGGTTVKRGVASAIARCQSPSEFVECVDDLAQLLTDDETRIPSVRALCHVGPYVLSEETLKRVFGEFRLLSKKSDHFLRATAVVFCARILAGSPSVFGKRMASDLILEMWPGDVSDVVSQMCREVRSVFTKEFARMKFINEVHSLVVSNGQSDEMKAISSFVGHAFLVDTNGANRAAMFELNSQGDGSFQIDGEGNVVPEKGKSGYCRRSYENGFPTVVLKSNDKKKWQLLGLPLDIKVSVQLGFFGMIPD